MLRKIQTVSYNVTTTTPPAPLLLKTLYFSSFSAFGLSFYRRIMLRLKIKLEVSLDRESVFGKGDKFKSQVSPLWFSFTIPFYELYITTVQLKRGALLCKLSTGCQFTLSPTAQVCLSVNDEEQIQYCGCCCCYCNCRFHVGCQLWIYITRID